MVSRLEWWGTYVGGKEVVKATQSILPKSILTGSHMLHMSLHICDLISAAFADGASHNDFKKRCGLYANQVQTTFILGDCYPSCVCNYPCCIKSLRNRAILETSSHK